MDKIKIDTNRLGTDAESIKYYMDNLAREIENMKGSVTALEGMWEGPGCKAFHKAFQDDMRAMETVIKNIRSIYSYDTNAKKEYESCERKVSSMIADIRV